MFFLELEFCSLGATTPFLWTNILKFYQFKLFFTKILDLFRKFKKNWGENHINQRKKKKLKLKQKTQGPGGIFRTRGTKWCYKKSLS